jgi:hypothetical protein
MLSSKLWISTFTFDRWAEDRMIKDHNWRHKLQYNGEIPVKASK